QGRTVVFLLYALPRRMSADTGAPAHGAAETRQGCRRRADPVRDGGSNPRHGPGAPTVRHRVRSPRRRFDWNAGRDCTTGETLSRVLQARTGEGLVLGRL